MKRCVSVLILGVDVQASSVVGQDTDASCKLLVDSNMNRSVRSLVADIDISTEVY